MIGITLRTSWYDLGVNPVAMFFASGESLYPGAVLLLASTMAARSSRVLAIWFARIATWTGLAFVIMACPPLTWWVDAIFGVAFLAWTISRMSVKSDLGWERFRRLATIALILVLVGITIAEFLHRKMPHVQGDKSDHLVVMGDSISAGLGTRQSTWPEVMKEMTGSNIKNLSIPGATVLQSAWIADQLSAQDRLVLIELGGNDLFSGETASEFGKSLDKLLAKVCFLDRTVVMFELPLLPQMVGFGQQQRRLASKYGVWLIPKRFLSHVISGKDATSDGLHLSEIGTHRMASLVADILRPVLREDSPELTTPATRP